jgi:hypothetical protein
MEVWRYSVIIVNLGTRWRRVVSFTLLPHCLWESSLRYPLYRRLGGPQSRSCRYRGETNLLPLPEMKARLLDRLARCLITIPSYPSGCLSYNYCLNYIDLFWNIKLLPAYLRTCMLLLADHSGRAV